MRNQDEDVPVGVDPLPSRQRLSRRTFFGALGAVGTVAGVASAAAAEQPTGAPDRQGGAAQEPSSEDGVNMTDQIVREKIRRARLSGPSIVTANATVVDMDSRGRMTVLSKGSNDWVCSPGNENIVGDVPMALDPMGMRWFMDLVARKPKPTNTSPGLIYMLCGAVQHSYTDPFDRTSPAIEIGPHWMVLWPLDAAAAGIGTVMRDAGTMVMFAGTPYAHLHICGSPWDGNEYRPGDRAIRTLTYARG